MTMIFSVLLPLFYLLFFMYLIGKLNYFKKSSFSSKGLNIAFLIKVFSGVFVYVVYSLYYPVRIEADTFRYFDDSQYLFDAIKSNPMDFFKMVSGIDCNSEYFNENYYNHMNNWFRPFDDGLFNDNRLIIRINAFIRLFSFGNYHVHSIFFNFFSFIGLYELAKFFEKLTFSKIKIYCAIFLIPSFVFWSSGILKETILVGILGILLNQAYLFFNENKSFLRLGIVLTCILLMSILKVYILLCFIPLIAYLIFHSKLIGWKRAFMPLLIITGVFIFLFFLFEDLNPIGLIVNKQHDFINLAESIDAGSKIEIPYLDGSFFGLVKSIPIALINTSFRPFPSDLNSLLIVLPFVENAILIVLLVFLLFQKKGHKLTSKQTEIFAYFCLVILLLFIIIGLTTPIIGAIVRYKIPVLPFLYLMVLAKINFEPLKKFKSIATIKKAIHKHL